VLCEFGLTLGEENKPRLFLKQGYEGKGVGDIWDTEKGSNRRLLNIS
jgi:hypothetical protein